MKREQLSSHCRMDCRLGLGELDRAVVITMVTVWVMEMTVNQVIDMVAMGNLLVSAVWAVDVRGVMTRALMSWRTGRRIGVC